MRSKFPLKPSGSGRNNLNELRDPCILEDEEKLSLLLNQSEVGIAVAELLSRKLNNEEIYSTRAIDSDCDLGNTHFDAIHSARQELRLKWVLQIKSIPDGSIVDA